MLGLLLDQNVDWYDGEWVDFFGRPACTNKGLALLARSTETPVIPYYNWRAEDGKFDVYFEPPVPLIKTGDKTQDIWDNTQNYNQGAGGDHPPAAGAVVLAAPALEDQAQPALAPGEQVIRPLDPRAPRRILLRATNWVGDAVMTLPALAALHAACPQAEIEVLARPWAAAVYAGQPGVSRVLAYDKSGEHAGVGGFLALARELRARGYDWAVLLQNAFEAALLAWLARVPRAPGLRPRWPGPPAHPMGPP